MLITTFKYVMRRKYYGYAIYFHNFSYFDSLFLVETLANLEDVKLNMTDRGGKILSLKLQFDKAKKTLKSGAKYKGTLNIYDSFLILPSALEKLGKTFGYKSDLIKGKFPLKILNDPNITYDYEGEVPDKKYFYEISNSEYKQYKDSFQNI